MYIYIYLSSAYISQNCTIMYKTILLKSKYLEIQKWK